METRSKVSSTARPNAKIETLMAEIAAARKDAKAARQLYRDAKSEYKAARKAFKRSRKAAKDARKKAKALEKALEQASRAPKKKRTAAGRSKGPDAAGGRTVQVSSTKKLRVRKSDSGADPTTPSDEFPDGTAAVSPGLTPKQPERATLVILPAPPSEEPA